MKNDNVTSVVSKLLKELDIKVTSRSIYNEFMKHPEYPSFFAISEILNNWLIPNAAYTVKLENLSKVPTPFIAHLSKKESSFILVKKIDEKEVTVANERFNNYIYPIEEFKFYYTGSILVAEGKEESCEIDYKANNRAEIYDKLRNPVVISSLFLFIISNLFLHTKFIRSFNLQVSLLLLFKLSGLFVSILLLIQSLDANNSFVQRLCTIGKNMNCNAILSSSAAKIFEGLTWSEVGFFYFAGSLFVLLFNSNNLSVLQLLSFINLLCLPYTFYSLYYQWRIAKQWCIFCCAVQAILWFEFFAMFPWLSQKIIFPMASDIIDFFICMVTPLFLWILIKPYIVKLMETRTLKLQLQRFKFNKETFKLMIDKETVNDLLDDKYTITLGNKEADNIVTMVTNPYCGPCVSAHKALDEWLDSRQDIKLQFIVSTVNDMGNIKTNVAIHWLNLQQMGKKALRSSLNDWYAQKHKDYNVWAKKHLPISIIDIDPLTLKIQQDWCDLVNIDSTPTIFINGRRLPNLYQAEDIKYLI